MWKNVQSNYTFIEEGVRQGGILSPFLFSLYINDIINDIVDTNIGCTTNDMRCNILAYADDLVILSGSVNDMDMLQKTILKY